MNISESQAKAIALGKLKGIGQAENTFDIPYDSVLEQVFEAWGVDFVKELREHLEREKLVASRDLQSSFGFRITVKGTNIVRFTLFAASHWYYANEGRRPGRKPPIKKIMEWIAHQGIPVRTSNGQKGKSVLEASRSLAHSIAWSIAHRGTIKRYGYKGSEFLSKVLPQSELTKLSRALSAATGQAIVLNLGFK